MNNGSDSKTCRYCSSRHFFLLSVLCCAFLVLLCILQPLNLSSFHGRLLQVGGLASGIKSKMSRQESEQGNTSRDVQNNCLKSPDGIAKNKPEQKYDLTRIGPLPFLTSYRNPCWWSRDNRSLQCLPYFYLAGFPKCGTTDMYRRIVRHPHVLPVVKEPHWITRARFKSAKRTGLESYSRIYGRKLQSLSSDDARKSIVGDGSASTAWDNHNWRKLPGNENCSEPRVLIADHIRHLNPNTKIIFMLRNPADEVYSGYMYFGHETKSQAAFHDLVLQGMAEFRSCLRTHSQRFCAYEVPNVGSLRLHVAMYSVYLDDWLQRFPRDQILPIRLEDVSKDSEKEMSKVFKFLGLGPPERLQMRAVGTLKAHNVGKTARRKGPMWPKTRAVLDKFFAPFNQRLGEILGDGRFAWREFQKGPSPASRLKQQVRMERFPERP